MSITTITTHNITTADEMDALPVNSYCLCGCGYHVAKSSAVAYRFVSGRGVGRDEMAEEHLPLIVLYRPDRPAMALREAADAFRPGDCNPWALYVRKWLDRRAVRIEAGGQR